MTREVITNLKYETKVTIGAYFKLNTNWFSKDDEIRSIIIDQDGTYSKILSIYPNDFYMYLEQDRDYSIYRTNYPLEKDSHSDVYNVVWDK